MVVVPVVQQHPHEGIQMTVVFTVGYALGLDHQKALEGVDYFLQYFPVLRGCPHAFQVPLDHFVNLLVFLYEDQDQVVRRLTDFRLSYKAYMYIFVRKKGNELREAIALGWYFGGEVCGHF